MTQEMVSPERLFADIGKPEAPHTAQEGNEVAVQMQQIVDLKAEKVTEALDAQETAFTETRALATSRLGAIQGDHQVFDLQPVLDGWFTPDIAEQALTAVAVRGKVQLNIDTASEYGVVPDSVVAQFTDSGTTKATGEARLEVAKVLDTATGITRKIAEDNSISADEVAKKAQKLLKVWDDARMLDALFRRLFTKTLNRVSGYQTRLTKVGADLAKKQVALEGISSSLVARQTLVKTWLLDTCVSGLALVDILEREQAVLADLQQKKAVDTTTPAAVYSQKIQEQQALIEIITKRLVDLKAFAIKLIGLYSVLGNTRFNVAIIKSDVVFTRTNLMATLGLQLGLVVDMIATLRIGRAARDIREAEAEAAEKVGVASAALNEAGNQALTDVSTTIRSLHATVTAAAEGIKNTQDNMQRVEEMSTKADQEFGALFATLAV